VTKARNSLSAFIGADWSVSWAQVGFTGPSLAVPAADDKLIGILGALATYYAANTTQQVTALSLTGPAAKAQRDALEAAAQAVTDSKRNQRTKKEERDAAEAALTEKINASRRELQTVLKPTDPRWIDFIDEVPADLRRPEKPEGLSVAAKPEGGYAVDWTDAVRADRYRVFKQVVGENTEPVLVETVDESEAEFASVPPGKIVKLQVIAVNAAGESAPSEAVELKAA